MSDLPQPNEAFDWVQARGGPALVCRPLARRAAHLFTTRHWTLGRDAPGWAEVAATLDIEPRRLVRVRQVHGAGALVVTPSDSGNAATTEADIIVAGGDSDHALAVQAADCVPLLLADRQTRAVAAAHAGWRGLALRVPSLAVQAMAGHFGSVPANLVAAVGPSIGACCYEVGRDVKERFEQNGHSAAGIARWFQTEPALSSRNPPFAGMSRERRADHWFFDAWTTARDQLVDAGVPPASIFVAELCTASHPNVLCSYRREGSAAGRIAGAIRVGATTITAEGAELAEP